MNYFIDETSTQTVINGDYIIAVIHDSGLDSAGQEFQTVDLYYDLIQQVGQKQLWGQPAKDFWGKYLADLVKQQTEETSREAMSSQKAQGKISRQHRSKAT